MTRLAAMTVLLTLGLPLACSSTRPALDNGRAPGLFHSPQGIAATSRHVLVVSSAFHFESGRPAYAKGWVTVIERASRRIVGRVPTSGLNPQHLATRGELAIVVSGGAIQIDPSGLAVAASDGALDLLDLANGPPSRPEATLPLPRGGADPRIGACRSLTLSADGKRAFIGSGTRGDLFMADLEPLRLRHPPGQPLTLFATAAGENGLTVPVTAGESLAVLDFNSDALCLIGDPGGELADRRCGSVGALPDLLEGPIDLAASEGRLYVLMSIANGLYRVDASKQPFSVERSFATTGLAPNRVLVHGRHAYVVNSLSSNLQRIDLESGRSELPFTVLPVGSGPYDLVITEEPEGLRGWITLQASNQVALVDLGSGALLELLPGAPGGDAGPPATGARLDARPRDGSSCPETGPPLVGIARVVSLQLGEGGGEGQEKLPGVIQGGPSAPGSTGETLSLGTRGEIVVDFGDWDIVDGPGPDLIVFENPFLTAPYQPYAEPALVALGVDGKSFLELPCDLSRRRGDPLAKSWPYPGCAGVRPPSDACWSPQQPALAGGDAFDLATVGLPRARFLRLRDAGLSSMGETTRGFDLDAALLIHYTRR